ESPPAPATFFRAQVDRHADDGLVETASIFAVEGAEGPVPQVHAPTQVRGPYTVGQLAGLRHGPVGEFVRYAKLAYRDLDFHTGIVDFAQDFYHPAKRLRMACRLLHDLDRNDLPVLSAVDLLRGNQDVVLDALVFRHHDAGTTFSQEASYQAIGAPLQ